MRLRVGAKPPHQTIYDGDRMVAVGITTEDAAWIVEQVNAAEPTDTEHTGGPESQLALEIAAAVAKSASRNNRKIIRAITEALTSLIEVELGAARKALFEELFGTRDEINARAAEQLTPDNPITLMDRVQPDWRAEHEREVRAKIAEEIAERRCSDVNPDVCATCCCRPEDARIAQGEQP